MASPALGFFLGGVAKQNNINRQLGLEEDRNAIALKKQVAEQGKALMDQFKAMLADPEFSKERYGGFYQTLLSAAEVHSKNDVATGGSGTTAAQMQALWGSAQNADEKAQSAAKREVDNLTAKIEAGVMKDPGQEAAPLMIKLQRARDEANARGDKRGAAEIQKQIDKLGTVVGLTPEDIAARGGAKTAANLQAKSGAAATESLRNISGNIEELEITAQKFADTPEAGGAIGAVLDTAAGLAGQIDQLAGTDIESLVPGDQEKITEARSSARFSVAMMLSTITGEESGRFTEQERKLAETTLRSLNETSSPRQIKVAYETTLRIMKRSLVRFADQLVSSKNIDLSTPDGRVKADEELQKSGLSPDQAADAIASIMLRKGINF